MYLKKFNFFLIQFNHFNFLFFLSLSLSYEKQKFGVVTAVKELLQKFNAINFTSIWYEFNLLSIILSYANENLTIAHDLTCQAEMMEIIPNLLAGTYNIHIIYILLYLVYQYYTTKKKKYIKYS
jgi:hypothetical protein